MRECPWCLKTFQPQRDDHLFCNYKCRRAVKDAYLPSPEEIQQVTAEIRAGWSREELELRQTQIPVRARATPRNARKQVEIFGETKTIRQWADDPRCVVSFKLLKKRICWHWLPVRALLQPSEPNHTDRRNKTVHEKLFALCREALRRRDHATALEVGHHLPFNDESDAWWVASGREAVIDPSQFDEPEAVIDAALKILRERL